MLKLEALASKPRVVLTHWVHPVIVELLERAAEVVLNSSRDTLPRAEILARAKDADALMVFMPDSVDGEFLAACPRLKIVAAALKGYDNFDVAACTRRGIWFSIVPDLLTTPTAELAIGLLLGVTRNVAEGDRRVRSGAFHGWRPDLYGTGLAGRTLGVIGMGAVGRAIAKRLAGFDMRLVYCDVDALDYEEERSLGVQHVTFDELLAASDFVMPMLPLNAQTFHLLDSGAIGRMKQGSYLINACRGSIVDEQAVIAAMHEGRLAGYAADVFEMEDWARRDRPQGIPRELLENSRHTLFTPHLGSAVADVRIEIERHAANSILQALSGQKPAGAVNDIRASTVAA